MSAFIRAVRENAFQSTEKTISDNCPFKSLNADDPHFPSSILEVDFPEKWQKRRPETEDALDENVKKLTNLLNEAMKSVDVLTKEMRKRPKPEENTPEVSEGELDTLLKEKVAALSGYTAHPDKLPAATKREVLRCVTEAVTKLNTNCSSLLKQTLTGLHVHAYEIT